MSVDIKSFTLEELKEFVKEMGLPAFRAAQIFEWMHVKLCNSFDDMTNLSLKLREELSDKCTLTNLEIVDRQVSKKDGTRKYLFKLDDGNLLESVFMPYKHGNSVCVSSQVGCKMGCRFCASTIGGWIRNLKASEILEQIYKIQKDTGERVDNVVIMGTGEPLDNYDNVLRFIKLLTREPGLRISQRSVTLSTCGLVPEIYKLAEEKLEITLAISLHAVNDAERRELMPIAQKYSINELMDAVDAYFDKTGRRISFEYSLVKGVNDSRAHAAKLAGLLNGKVCHVNLIKVNPVTERNYYAPEDQAAYDFQNKLEKSGINVTIRREMGRDIDGACGQLRRRHLDKYNI